MTLPVFYLITFVAALVILGCIHLNRNCSFSRLIKEYQQRQYDLNGIVRANMDINNLISLIGPDRLRYCYGIKFHEQEKGDPILFTQCDWDINDKLKGLYRSKNGPATLKFIK